MALRLTFISIFISIIAILISEIILEKFSKLIEDYEQCYKNK